MGTYIFYNPPCPWVPIVNEGQWCPQPLQLLVTTLPQLHSHPRPLWGRPWHGGRLLPLLVPALLATRPFQDHFDKAGNLPGL